MMKDVLARAPLDGISRDFADRLFSDFIDWENLAELLTDSDGIPTGAFRVFIPKPQGDSRLELWTLGGEITVAFGEWHAHYGTFLGISEQEAIASAIEDIHKILEERSIIRVSYKDGAWKSSTLQDAIESLAPAQQGENVAFIPGAEHTTAACSLESWVQPSARAMTPAMR